MGPHIKSATPVALREGNSCFVVGRWQQFPGSAPLSAGGQVLSHGCGSRPAAQLRLRLLAAIPRAALLPTCWRWGPGPPPNPGPHRSSRLGCFRSAKSAWKVLVGRHGAEPRRAPQLPAHLPELGLPAASEKPGATPLSAPTHEGRAPG